MFRHSKPQNGPTMFKKDFEREMRSLIRRDPNRKYITSLELTKLVIDQDWKKAWKTLDRSKKKEYLDKAARHNSALSAKLEQEIADRVAEKIAAEEFKNEDEVASVPVFDPPSLDCTICLENPKSMLFRPCKHVAVCSVCSKTLKICPICRAQIDQIELIFIV